MLPGVDMETVLPERWVHSEGDLIRLTRTGDRGAFGELVRRHDRRAYFAALGLVGDREDARDLSQDAFVRAFGARKTIDPERPFYTWFYQILRRLCFNFNRDRALHREKLDQVETWLVDQATERLEADPGRAAEAKERRGKVRAAIERLPEREREALVLREFEGLRYREMADLLGIPIGTVMSRLYAARKSLADRLEVES